MNAARDAGPTDAAARFTKARDFAETAALLFDEATGTATYPDVFVTNAVHAGIAASDVICIRLLGRFSASGNHDEAVTLLKTADPASAKHLQRLLSVKTKAGYSTNPVSNADVKEAQRAHRALMDRAGEV